MIYECEMRRLFFLPRRRVIGLRTGICLISISLLFCAPAWTQLGKPPPTPTASKTEAPEDPLGRTSPRGTVLGFLKAGRKGDDELAVRYLNTRLRGKAAVDLAGKLFTVLDRGLPPKLNELSDDPQGSLSYTLSPDQERVGTIVSNDRNLDIFVERVDRGKSGSLWLFSSKTLDAIPDMYEELNETRADRILPEFLTQNQFAGLPLYLWLAVFMGMPLFYLFTTLLNRVLSSLVGTLRRHLGRKPGAPNPDVLPGPVRLLLLATMIRWLLTKFSLPLLARQFWFSTASVITIAGCAWLMILLSDWAGRRIHRRLPALNLTGAGSMLRLVRWAVNGLIIFVCVLLVLHHFGVNPTTALAGLGIGGIAVALAAQKTLENVIGGVSLIVDRAVRVGETLKVGDTLGTVDDIGLRSTRIRALDRTLVSVPNGQIANMSLGNLSSRDKFWFHHVLSLHYGTTSQQLQAVLDGIRHLVAGGMHIEAESVRVRFLGFGASSLNVDAFAYVEAGNWNQFLEIQETLLLRIMECVESCGVQIALPSQTIFVTTASTTPEAKLDGWLKTPEPDKKTTDLPTIKS